MGYAWRFQAFSGAFGGIEVDREALRGGLLGAFGGVEVAAEVLDYYFWSFFGFFNCAVCVGFLVFS